MQIVVATVSWSMGVKIDFLSVPFHSLISNRMVKFTNYGNLARRNG